MIGFFILFSGMRSVPNCSTVRSVGKTVIAGRSVASWILLSDWRGLLTTIDRIAGTATTGLIGDGAFGVGASSLPSRWQLRFCRTLKLTLS